MNDTPPPDDGRLRVLVVDDEDDLRLGLAKLLGRVAATRAAKDGVEALALARDETFDVVVTDLRMPQMGGAELLAKLKSLAHPPEVVLVTGYGTIQTAVACLQAGAAHFLTKPFDNDEVLRIVERLGRQARAARGLAVDLAVAAAPLAEEPEYVCDDGIVAADPVMRRTLELVDRVAQSPVSVLVEGESGTGKELLARAIHASSRRASARFVAENCAALPDTLLENELFGHERGAFTGADAAATGLFERADGGTLFLDEVGDMSPNLQKRLLRVLQEGEVRRVGGSSVRKVDVRVVTATNRDLLALVKEGRFREDLYYRLAVVKIRVPPLRERREDVPALVEHCLNRFRGKAPAPPVSDAAMDALVAYDWPGNVRQLENEMRRAAALARGPVDIDLLSPELREAKPAPVGGAAPSRAPSAIAEGRTLRDLVEDLEVGLLRGTLERERGNITRAAEALGLSRLGLRKKLARYRLGRRGGEAAPPAADVPPPGAPGGPPTPSRTTSAAPAPGPAPRAAAPPS